MPRPGSSRRADGKAADWIACFAFRRIARCTDCQMKIFEGGGVNVFADLGFDDATEQVMATRADLKISL